MRRKSLGATLYLLKKTVFKFLLACVGCAVGAALLVQLMNPEPSYHGKKLSVWVKQLQSGEPGARQEAIEALKNMPDAVPYLSRRIARKPGLVDRFAGFASSHLPGAIKRPLRKLYDPGPALSDQHLAAQAVQQMGTNAASAVSALEDMLHHPNVLLSGSAGVALGKIGPVAVPVLVKALDDPDFNVRSAACQALAELHTNSAPAIGRLCAIVNDETGPIVSSAAYTLTRIRTPAVPAVVPMLTSTNWETRRWGAFILGNMGPHASEAIPELVAAARDDRMQVRWAAVEALGRVGAGSREAADGLLEALHDPEANIRATAVEGLGFRGGVIRRNLPQFVELLDDPSPQVRKNVAIALGRLGQFGTNALPQLERLAKEDVDNNVRASAQEAIQTIK